MNRMTIAWRYGLASILAMLLAACAAPTKTEVSFEAGKLPPLAAGGGVVLFSAYREQMNPDEADFVRCLRKEFSARMPGQFRLVDTVAFQNALFPWFEPETAPRTVEQLNALLARPLARQRIAVMGVRYLLVIASAESADGFPGIICGAGYGGAGCLGVYWEEKVQRARAVIWDVERGMESGAMAATSSGKSVGFALGIPVLFIAKTRENACHALADELARLLSDAAGLPAGKP